MEFSKKSFENVFCAGIIMTSDSSKDIIVQGIIRENVDNNEIYYIASAPPDYRATYTGSGLPFATQEQAFDNSPNFGKVVLTDNTFDIRLMFPNSYYVGLGTVIVPPTLYIQYVSAITKEKRNITIKLSDGIPYRMLSYPIEHTRARTDAMFYKDGWEMPVRTQEQILRDSGYPSVNKMHSNFWGLKPPL